MNISKIIRFIKKDFTAWLLVVITIGIGGVSILTARLLRDKEFKSENASAAVTTVALNVVEDSNVSLTNATTNYGANTVVEASDYNSNTRYSYLKFNLSSLAGKTITSASLKVKVALTSPVNKVFKLVPANSWNESAVNWNNKPPFGTSVGTYSAPLLISGQVVTIPLTVAEVQKYVGTTLSFGTDNTGAKNTFRFYSKENGAVSAPQLVVTYSDVVLPTPTTAPTASACTVGFNIATPTPSGVCKVEFELPDTAVCWHDARTIGIKYRVVSLPSAGGPYYLQTDWFVSSPVLGSHHYAVHGPVTAGYTGTINASWPGVPVGETRIVEIHAGLNILDRFGTPVSPNCSDGMDYYWTPFVCRAPTPTPGI